MSRISIRHIQEVIASDFDVPLFLLRSPARQRDLAWPRQYAMLLARELTPHSTFVIGRIFDRDRSTVAAGVIAAKRRLAKDQDLALKVGARALLLQCEPKKSVDSENIGFFGDSGAKPLFSTPIHNSNIHTPAGCGLRSGA